MGERNEHNMLAIIIKRNSCSFGAHKNHSNDSAHICLPNVVVWAVVGGCRANGLLGCQRVAGCLDDPQIDLHWDKAQPNRP